MFHRALVGVIDLRRVVSAAMQLADVVVGHVFDELEQFGVFAEEVFADVRAALGFEGLVFPVYALVHALAQESGVVALE